MDLFYCFVYECSSVRDVDWQHLVNLHIRSVYRSADVMLSGEL